MKKTTKNRLTKLIVMQLTKLIVMQLNKPMKLIVMQLMELTVTKLIVENSYIKAAYLHEYSM